MIDGGTNFTLASRPFNDASLDMGLPPYARRLDVRATRAAFAAGTLSTVGDDASGEDVQGDVEVRDADGYDPDVVQSLCLCGAEIPHVAQVTCRCGRTWYAAKDREAERQARLRRWQTIR